MDILIQPSTVHFYSSYLSSSRSLSGQMSTLFSELTVLQKSRNENHSLFRKMD